MDDDTLTEIISQRWTASELVEFLDLDVVDVIEKFRRVIDRNIGPILEEIGYEEEPEDE